MWEHTYKSMNEKLRPGAALETETLQKMEARREALARSGEKHVRRGLRRAVSCMAALFLACGLLLGANAAFPAFAEELPLLGPVFRRINEIGGNASTYDGLIQPVGASAEAGSFTLESPEAYCDGKHLFFSLKLSSDDPELSRLEQLYPARETGDPATEDSGYILTVNGEPAALSEDILFRRKDDCATTLHAVLSQEVKDGENLHVELTLLRMQGFYPETVENMVFWWGEPDVTVDRPISLSFDVTADTGYNLTAPAEELTVENVTLRGWESSPTSFTADLSYPWYGWDPVYVEARTDEGAELPLDQMDDGQGNFQPVGLAKGDTAQMKFTFVGPPADTAGITLTVWNHQPGEYTDCATGDRMGPAVFAEFHIDLSTGRIAQGSTYLDRGYEQVNISEYGRQFCGTPEFKDHVFVLPSRVWGSTRYDPEDHETPKNGCFESTITVYADTAEELPYEARFFLDGQQFAAVPLCRKTDENAVLDHGRTNWYTSGENFDAWAYNGRLGISLEQFDAASTYVVNACKLDLRLDPETDPYQYWRDHGGKVQLVNTETSETVYDSAEDVRTLYPLPE